MDLHVLWFGLLGVLLTGYAILDGFDLGVGILHPFIRGDRERRLVLNSIGPLWDGNEVWLVTFGGALFAAFPEAYATLLSGFYLPIMVVLLSLIGRAISIEFRSKRPGRAWRTWWDLSFWASSLVATFTFGLALGNAFVGVPLGEDRIIRASLGELFGPFAVATGVLAVAGAAMHGAIYLHLKTEGELQQRVRKLMWIGFGAFGIAYVAVTGIAIATVPHAIANFERWPVAWAVVVLNGLAVLNIPRSLHSDRPGWAFVSSSCSIAALTFLVGMALFPNIVVSSLDPAFTLDIYSAASSEGTLARMAIIALIGMPLVATYTAIVYWVFRGKVRLDEHSY